MSFDSKLFGKKLNRRRAQLEVDVSQLSIFTGILEERINELESGLSKPTGDEILVLADYFQVDYNYFISNQADIASDRIDILYRVHGEKFNAQDRRAIQEFMFLCECEAFTFKELGLTHRSFDFAPEGDFYKAHGERAANTLRDFLGYSDNMLISDPYYVFRSLGLHIFRRKLLNSSISGLFINHPTAGKCILINYHEDIFRQNFTLAHEIAHSIFDHDQQINVSTGQWKSSEIKEIRANTFASNFLIPRSLLGRLSGEAITSETIAKLAINLRVNVEPLLISLLNHGIIKPEKKKQLSGVKISKEKKIDPELQNLSERYHHAKVVLLEKGISTYYVNNCYECYRLNKISAGRLAEMLLCDEFELGYLLKLFNLQLLHGN